MNSNKSRLSYQLIRLSPFLCLLLLYSCASISKDECLIGNWELKGYEDGSRGYAVTRLSLHSKECAKYGRTPNLKEYEAGRSRGLKVYCVAHKGYQLGLRSGNYNHVCPADLETHFLTAYQYGKDINAARSNYNNQSTQYQQSKDDLEHLYNKINKIEAELVQTNVSQARRIQLVKELRHINDEDIPAKKDRIIHEEEKLIATEARLNTLYKNDPYARHKLITHTP